ncbi:MAG: hypothetical protein ACRDWI_04095 [Jiangellaceae bacterium]
MDVRALVVLGWSRIGPEPKRRNHIRQLESLGYKVTLEPAA